MKLTRDQMVERMLADDRSADRLFVVGVRTTGIYCLPSCRPARRPKPENVEFYDGPAAARAAGLRACKLCRPDELSLAGYPDEVLVEGLVERFAVDPGACRNVAALAEAAGLSLSRLHGLVRTHYHTTPAELLTRWRVAAARTALLEPSRPVAAIAFATGFESLSAFNENFRHQAALTPSGYRRLLAGSDFDLALPPDYPIERVLAYLGRDPLSPTERVEGRVYTAAVRVGATADGQGAVVVRVELSPGIARCRIVAGEPADAAGRRQLHEQVLRVLGLTSDPARFEAQVAATPELAPLIEGQRGLRIPLVADPFDGLVWAIAGQQITLAYARTLRRRLIERVSAVAGAGLYAPPSAQAVAALAPEDLIALGFSTAKTRYLLGAAGAVVDGSLPLAALAGKSATRIERTLLGMHGIGPWTAHYLLLRVFGFLDCVPLGDTGMTSGLQRFFALDRRPGRREALDLMERFSPYRSLATFHLWQRSATLG